MPNPAPGWVVAGRIAGMYGVRGWVRVMSFTDPPDNLLGFPRWRLDGPQGSREVTVLEGRRHGKGLVARLGGVADRDAAAALIGAEVAVERASFDPPEAGHYYWADLEGLVVATVDGTELGRVDHLVETGANDVMVVAGERRRLVPFVAGDVVVEVDLAGGRIVVDWPADF